MTRLSRKLFSGLLAGVAAGCLAWASPARSAAPDKLSDLHKFLIQNVEQVFGTSIPIKAVVVGLSRQIVSNGRFRQVDLSLGSFDYQDLHFSDGELLMDHLWVDPQELAQWRVKVDHIPESSNKLVFTLPSLQKKLCSLMGNSVQVQAVVGDQMLQLNGKGRFLGLPMDYQTEATLQWKDHALRLMPKKVVWGYWRIPSWLCWMGRGNCPRQPVLALPDCWVPWNIQQVHLSWDHVVLSTDW